MLSAINTESMKANNQKSERDDYLDARISFLQHQVSITHELLSTEIANLLEKNKISIFSIELISLFFYLYSE